MNIDLENENCPVCNAKLFTDEVAFCPDCGAPHHKSCFLQNGACFYADRHDSGFKWQPTKVPYPNENAVEQDENKQKFKKCLKCGFLNDEKNAFCKKCGFPLVKKAGENQKASADGNPFFKVNGLDENEEIEGVKLREIASFVGYNALRYIRKFKKMASDGVKTSWNWVAFLFSEYWLISRKMYVGAILKSFLTAVFSVCLSLCLRVTGIENLSMGNFDGVSPVLAKSLYLLAFLTLAINIILGIFGDYFYKRKVISKVKELKSVSAVTDFDLMRAGGVSITMILLLRLGIEIFVSIILMNF